MKRLIALTVPLLVLVVTVAAIATLESQRKPDWRLELDAYIAARAVSETITVQSVAEARAPENFEPHMGRPVPGESTWGERLPYPPLEVRCVLLSPQKIPPPDSEDLGEPGPSERQIIYVAYFSDALWHVGWLLHEGAREPFAPDELEPLATLGCDLPVE